MIILGALAVAAILAAPPLAHAQTYSRCVDATGRLHLTDTPPAGVHCVALAKRELADTPARVETVTVPPWMVTIRLTIDRPRPLPCTCRAMASAPR